VDVGQLFSQGVTFGAVFAVVALGYHVIHITTGVLNFALGEQMVIAGLLADTLLRSGVSLVAAIALTVIIGALIGVVYERVALAPAAAVGPVGPIIASIGVALVLIHGRTLLWGPNPRGFAPFTGSENQSVTILGGRWLIQSFWVIGLAAAAAAALLWFLHATPWGRRWRATAQSALGARLCGVSPAVVSMGAVAMASALVTLMGIAIAPISLAGGFFGLEFGIKGFAAAIIGGFDSTAGVMVGGLLIGLLDSGLAGTFSTGLADATLFALLIAMLLVRPYGLLGQPAVDRA
jgi:branched-chain amino acid transport system permease protein